MMSSYDNFKKGLLALVLAFSFLRPLPAQQSSLENLDLLSLQEEIGKAGANIPADTLPENACGGYASYDYSGLPLYAFTEETKVSALIKRAIGGVNRTLDVALYNLQAPEATKALLAAGRRGVRVRIVLDYGHVYPKANPEIQRILDSGMEIRLMKGRGGSGSMHNKYAIFDGSALETGSANWSLLAEDYSFENMMFVFSPEIISGYQKNFEWMWSQAGKPGTQGSWPKPVSPPRDETPGVNFNGTALPDYVFSPRGGTADAIVRAVDAASSEIDVAMFSFTSKPIMDALYRARARGVKVKIMTNKKSAFPFEEEAGKAGIELRFKPGRSDYGLMHNKFCVLDGRLLINGSFNWSDTAETLNTENTIFTTDQRYVSAYKAEFNKLYKGAKAALGLVTK